MADVTAADDILYYRLPTAARMADMSSRELRRRIERGELAAFRAGHNTILIRASDLREWAERRPVMVAGQ